MGEFSAYFGEVDDPRAGNARHNLLELIFVALAAVLCGAEVGTLEGVVAIDGKALRGAYDRGRKATPLHLVNVWAAEKRLVIGQRLAPGRNEVAGVLEALTLLRLDGCIVTTADALHCRPDTAQAILATGADYALAIKENRPKLLASAKALIAMGEQADIATIRSGPAHDRTEIRHAIVVPAETLDFPGIAAVG